MGRTRRADCPCCGLESFWEWSWEAVAQPKLAGPVLLQASHRSCALELWYARFLLLRVLAPSWGPIIVTPRCRGSPESRQRAEANGAVKSRRFPLAIQIVSHELTRIHFDEIAGSQGFVDSPPGP